MSVLGQLACHVLFWKGQQVTSSCEKKKKNRWALLPPPHPVFPQHTHTGIWEYIVKYPTVTALENFGFAFVFLWSCGWMIYHRAHVQPHLWVSFSSCLDRYLKRLWVCEWAKMLQSWGHCWELLTQTYKMQKQANNNPPQQTRKQTNKETNNPLVSIT